MRDTQKILSKVVLSTILILPSIIKTEHTYVLHQTFTYFQKVDLRVIQQPSFSLLPVGILYRKNLFKYLKPAFRTF